MDPAPETNAVRPAPSTVAAFPAGRIQRILPRDPRVVIFHAGAYRDFPDWDTFEAEISRPVVARLVQADADARALDAAREDLAEALRLQALTRAAQAEIDALSADCGHDALASQFIAAGLFIAAALFTLVIA